MHTNLLHRHDVARESYDLALGKNPNQGLAWLHRGVLSAFQGRGAEAVRETGHAVTLSPLDPWRYYYDSLCATAALAAQDYEAAIALADARCGATACTHRHCAWWRSPPRSWG